MARTSTALTATVTAVRNEILSPPSGTDGNVWIEVAVKASDLAALLTPAEKALLSYPGQQTNVMFGCYLTDDAGNSLGSGSSYPGVFSFSRVSLTTDNELALAAYLRAH